MPDRRDARRIRHEMFEMVMARVSAEYPCVMVLAEWLVMCASEREPAER
jgi:hypothetical protein